MTPESLGSTLGDPLTWGFCQAWSRLTAGASSSKMSRTPRGTMKLQLQPMQLSSVQKLNIALLSGKQMLVASLQLLLNRRSDLHPHFVRSPAW